MRLFTKIFLQVGMAFLLVSQLIFGYLLFQYKKQSIENVEKYENTIFQNMEQQFLGRMRSKEMSGTKEYQDIWAVTAFRQYFRSRGVLYRDQEELFNATPYVFELREIKEQLKEKEDYADKSLVLQSGEKTLMVFCSGDTNLGYQMIYYKDITYIFRKIETLFLNGVLFMFLALLVIGGILFLGLYRTMKPLVELKKAAASIAEGAYHIRLPLGRKDEIGELAASFNQMAEKVEEHIKALSDTNEAQRRLLGSLAHELKTPMTAIIGYADTLLTVRLSDIRREQALNYIGDECRRLSRLAVKMLELAGLYETGETTVKKKKEKLCDLFERVKKIMDGRLREKGIQLTVRLSSEDVTWEMDEDLMMSLLMNLLDNAWKASKEGGKILLNGDQHTIIVEDDGMGIPSDDLPRVKEAFYMVDKSRAKSAGSVGLGLSICQQIAELHGAELIVESEEGKGTRVTVSMVE